MLMYAFMSALFGAMKWLISLFPSMDSLNIPRNVLGMGVAVGGWIDVDSMMAVLGLVITIYSFWGTAFIINWLIKRLRGG
jgi:hypothetical protein